MDRRLGTSELTLFEIDRVHPLNFTTVGRIHGPLTEAALQAALTAAVGRHPHLSHRLVVEPSGEVWLREGGAPPSLRFVAGGDWVAEADAEVNQPHARDTGPLVRCVVLSHAPLEHTVLLTFHHCIADGFSGAYLMRDLVQALAAAAPGSTTPPLAPLPDLPPMDELLPASSRGLGGWWARLFFVLRMAWNFFRLGAPHVIRDDRTALAHQRRARVIPEVLGPDDTARLTERAKAEGTTVHGALSAALILAMCHDASATAPTRIAFGAPVNLRQQLQPAVGEHLGLFVSMAAWDGRVPPDADFWALARDVRASLVRDVARGLHVASLQAMGLLRWAMGAGRAPPEVLARRMEQRLLATGGLTNLGRLELQTRFGDWRIEALHFLTSPSALGAWVSTATTLNGTLFWNFTFCEPAISEVHARKLAAGAVQRLKAALQGPSRAAPAPEVDRQSA